MELYPDRLVADLGQLPGAEHTFLRQVCAPDASAVRDGLRASVARLDRASRERAIGQLSSFDNRKFFQGFAEVAARTVLGRAGWASCPATVPGARAVLRREGVDVVVSVLAFVHQTRPGGDARTLQRLVDSLQRIGPRHRFTVLVRRWLPHDFDPEPIRRSIEIWLQQVASGRWEGRYAAYEDERVSLEFCLTGERARGASPAVVMALGPFTAHRSMAVLEPRCVEELDRHVASAHRDLPLILVAASDQPWPITPGYLRDFLLGRPTCTSREDGASVASFDGPASVCAFREPVYGAFSAFILMDRDPAEPLSVRARGWLNPWARRVLKPEELGVPAFAGEPAAMRWCEAGPAAVRL
jgi:hypothetical protein